MENKSEDLKKTKPRSRNFTDFEKNLLFDIVSQQFLHILENKQTDAVNVAKKNSAWENISKMYNCQAQSGPRSAKQLHALYDLLKKNARSNLHADKKQHYKTGGGTYVPKSGILDEKITGILKPQFEPLANKFDSSSVYFNSSQIEEITAATTEDVSEIDTHMDYSINNNTTTIILDDIAEDVWSTSVIVPTSPVRSSSPIASTLTASISNAPAMLKNRKRKQMANQTEEMPQTKKKYIDILTNRFVKRKNLKDERDEEVKKQKQAILEVELEIKKKQLEAVENEIEFKKELNSVNLQIKKKELEAKENELEHQKQLFSLELKIKKANC